jgi:hypothetical protein
VPRGCDAGSENGNDSVGLMTKSNKTVTILSLPVREKMEKAVDCFLYPVYTHTNKNQNISLKSIHP